MTTSRFEILNNAEQFFVKFFRDKVSSYNRRTYDQFNINPFTVTALALAVDNTVTPDSIAKAIVYPYALGTSMSTSFGTHIQEFIVTALGDTITPSVVSGMDIQFKDALDGRQKYCQLKAGPQTINKDDIETIDRHFRALRNLAVTNHLPLQAGDGIVGVIYGTHDNLSTMYLGLEKLGYPVYAGDDFWVHVTGYENLYQQLIGTAQDAAATSGLLDSVNHLLTTVRNGVEQNKDTFGL